MFYLLDNVGVLEIFQERDFTDRGRRDAVIFAFEADSFNGDNLICECVYGFINDTIRAFTETLTLLIFLQACYNGLRCCCTVLTVDHVCADVSVNVIPDGLSCLLLHFYFFG